MSKVVELCGDVPQNFKKIDFSSNPNFVFENDPTYQARQLFDVEGNTVFVNSFIECENYVSGGWDYSPITNNEFFLIDLLTYIVVILLFITYSKNIIKKLIKK
jgi:hypothetical protein